MFRGFPYKTQEELLGAAKELNLSLPWSQDVSNLSVPVKGKNFTLPNALCAQPMEGNDSTQEGAPTDFTLHRYRRLAAGGAGLIWLEAVAVCEEGRANPRQLMITPQTAPAFADLAKQTRIAAQEAGFPAPLLIVQLTHSGRNTHGTRIAASAHPVMNPHQKLPMDYPIIADDELLTVQKQFAAAAELLGQAGFDGVDIKCCHLYLLSELLGAKNRPGPYGGDWQGRSRMQIETTKAVIKAGGNDLVYAVRMNVCDAMTGGFCTDENLEPDFTEALDLSRTMANLGVTLLNTTMGTPYYNPHINRPYASHPQGEGYDPPEAPLRGVARLLSGNEAIQKALPDTVCVATGFSYLRQFAPYVAAGMVAEGSAKSVGFGREWLAYPDFAKDILSGGMEQKKCCVTCGLCTYLMRRGKAVGCPVRDKTYLPLLRQAQGKE